MTFEDVKKRVRARYGSVTAWRVGVIVGSEGLTLECPYSDPNQRRRFREGLAYGEERRK